MKNKLAAFFSTLLCVLFLFCSFGQTDVWAASDTNLDVVVHVRGNINAYPFEYYDDVDQTYKGVIPDILSRIAEMKNLEIVYLSPSDYAEHVDLETVVINTNERERADYILSLLSVNKDKGPCTFCISFTKTTSEYTKKCITDALSELTENEKADFLLSYADDIYEISEANRSLSAHLVAIIMVTLCLLAIVIISIRREKKRKGNEIIDALQHLVSSNVRSFYSCAYLAFDVEKVRGIYGQATCKKIEGLILNKLAPLLSSKEYVSRTQRGVFAVLFRADSRELCEERIANIVEIINMYLVQQNPGWNDFVRAGVCRIEDHNDESIHSILEAAKEAYICAIAQELRYYISVPDNVISDAKRSALLAQIDNALKNKEFKAHLQFVYSATYDCICGAELLSRWQNPEFGLLGPFEYIDILKETEKIVEHDYAIFEIACQQLEFWQSTRYSNLFLSCNFTRISCTKPDFSDRIKEIASKYDFPHENLIVEITEDSLSLNSEVLSQNIEQIRLMGFVMAFDDMGAGFSSLADLYDNEIDVVKIERAFLVSCNSPRRERMLNDLIELIHNTGSKVITEGVEVQEQNDMLAEMHCDMVQGFFHSRVMPLYRAGSFLNDKRVSHINVLHG